MEVSSEEIEPTGHELIQTVVGHVGLPEQWVQTELEQAIEHSGHNTGELTLEQLREVLAAYLESMNAEMLAESERTTDK